MFQCIFVTLRRRRRFLNFFSRFSSNRDEREGFTRGKELVSCAYFSRAQKIRKRCLLKVRTFLTHSYEPSSENLRGLLIRVDVFKVDFLTTTFPGSLSSAYLGRHSELAILLVSTKNGDL